MLLRSLWLIALLDYHPATSSKDAKGFAGIDLRRPSPPCFLRLEARGVGSGNLPRGFHAQGGPPSDPPEQDPRIDELEKRVANLERLVASQAVEIVRLKLRQAGLEKNDEAVVKILREALRSPVLEVRDLALREISAFPPERLVPLLQDLRQVVGGDPAEAMRLSAVELLSRFPQAEKDAVHQAVEGIILACRDASPAVRRAAALALRAYPADAGFLAMRVLLEDPELSVRLAAIETLSRSGHPDAGAELLRYGGRAQAAEEIAALAQALGKLRPPGSLPLVQAYLNRVEENVRWACLKTLGDLGDPEGIASARKFLDTSHSPLLREAALQTLGRLNDREGVRGIVEIANSDPDARIRVAALASLGLIGTEEALEALVTIYLGEGAERLREAARDALRGLTARSLPMGHRLMEKLRDRKRKSEAADFYRHLAAAFAGPEHAAGLRACRVTLAEFLFAEGDYREALEHWKALSEEQKAPLSIWRYAVCLREVTDLDSAARLLEDLLASLPQDAAMRPAVRLDLARVLEKKNMFVETAEEAHAVLLSASGPLRAEAEEVRNRAVRAILAEMRDPAKKKGALEKLRKLGKKATPAILAALERAPEEERPILVEAGNAAAGTQFPADAMRDARQIEEIRGAWLSGS